MRSQGPPSSFTKPHLALAMDPLPLVLNVGRRRPRARLRRGRDSPYPLQLALEGLPEERQQALGVQPAGLRVCPVEVGAHYVREAPAFGLHEVSLFISLLSQRRLGELHAMPPCSNRYGWRGSHK